MTLYAFDAIDDDTPTVFLAYTIKGWQTPLAGHKDNHGGIMNKPQMAEFQKAMGVAQGAREEAETAMKSMVDRWLADRDFVTREEFDAVRAMAQKAREENEALRARIDALEASGK